MTNTALVPASGPVLHSSEYPVSGSPAEIALPVVLHGCSRSGRWKHALLVPLAPGADQTPPRFPRTIVRTDGRRLSLALMADQILEGNRLASIQARITSSPEYLPVALLPLDRVDQLHVANWVAPALGTCAVQMRAEDEHGNVGHGLVRTFLVADPADPGVLHAWGHATSGATPEAGTWRSDEGRQTWLRLGLMVSSRCG